MDRKLINRVTNCREVLKRLSAARVPI